MAEIHMSRISITRDIPRRDGLPCWPERAIGRDPLINMAEVERALARPRRSKCTTPAPAPQTAKADRRRTPGYSGPPADIGQPPMMSNGRKMTFAEAGRILGVTGPAAYKKIHRYGWAKALAPWRQQ